LACLVPTPSPPGRGSGLGRGGAGATQYTYFNGFPLFDYPLSPTLSPFRGEREKEKQNTPQKLLTIKKFYI
jgi:hypothetical protein